MKHPHKRGGSCALAQKKNVVFVTFICVLFQCMGYRINFQNTYTFTYPKTLFHRLFLVFKIFQCILTSSSENNPLTLNPSPIAFPQINAPALDFGALKCSAYRRAELKRGRRLSQSKRNYFWEISRLCELTITINNYDYGVQSYIYYHYLSPFFSLFAYLFHMRFNLVMVSLWSDF